MPTVEEILAYFGTYTPGVDGAVSSFKFEYLTSLGFAAIVIFDLPGTCHRQALRSAAEIRDPRPGGVRPAVFHCSCYFEGQRPHRHLL